MTASFKTEGTYTPDNLLAGNAHLLVGRKVTVLAYERGDFNSNALTLGAGHTVASIREGLRAKGITLLTAVA